MAVGDRHLVEGDSLPRPGEALARDLADLARGVGSREQAHGAVGLRGRVGDREEAGARLVERGARGGRGKLLGFGTCLDERGAQVLVGGVELLAAAGGDEHRHRDGPAYRDQRLSERGRRLPRPVGEQRPPRWIRGVRCEQAVVGAVEAGAPAQELAEDLAQRLLLRGHLARAGERGGERVRVVACAAQLADQAVKRVAEARRLAHGREVAVELDRDLTQQDPVGQWRQRPAPLGEHGALAELERELAGHQEADVGDAPVALPEPPLQVRALERPAQQDADGRERVARLDRGDALAEGLLERLGGAGN